MSRPTNDQVKSWYPRLFRSALRMTGNAEDAADLTQEAFIKALENWDQFKQGSLPTTWIYRILVNCVRDWVRRQAIRKSVSLVDEWGLVVCPRPGVEENMDRSIQMERIRDTVKNLPVKLRSIFIATIIDGYTYEEAAELFSIPIGTVASRVSEARKTLRNNLRAFIPEVRK
jgi:RNA polymerase sigma-70 factor, ECF subfamily